MYLQRNLLRIPVIFLCAISMAALLFMAPRYGTAAHASSKALNIPATTSNGVGQKPYMGWSSWSLESTNYSGYNTIWLNAAHVKAQSDVVHQKLQSHGYQYINIDAGWWMDNNWTSEFDSYGRPRADATRFPAGMADIGNYVHNNGQKFGIYFNPGMDPQVYNQNYPIYGTSCHAQDIVVQPLTKTNGWLGNYAINYSNPCAQAYINSIANQFASWGVDYLKLDGVTPGSGRSVSASDNRPDVQAWSQALQQSGRSIWLELSWSLDHNYLSTWQQYANGWRIDTDVECYCGTLVTWDNSIKARFNDVVPWINSAGPGSWNDLDSLDVGSGTLDGISQDERQTYMTLWAIESAPLFTGDDLTQLDSYGTSLLTNDEVIAVDQSGHAAHPVSQSSNQQVWFSNNTDGSYTVALFNLNGSAANVTANWSDLGFSGSASVRDLWSHSDLGNFNNNFSASLNGHGSRLLKVTPVNTSTLSYEAEAANNTIGGGASVVGCSACSGGQKVGNIGSGAYVQLNSIYASNSGSATATIYYIDGDTGRSAQLGVNGGAATTLNFHGTNDNNWNTVQSMNVSVNLNAGSNSIKLSSASGWAPDFDRIVIRTGAGSYEAESSINTLGGSASVVGCSACSGGQKVGNIGNGAYVRLNNIYEGSAGNYTLTLYYIDGDSGRSGQLSVNGGGSTTINFHGTNDNNWNSVQSMTMTVALNAGNNTITLSAPSGWTVDLDRITV
ncbi:hypothetical protein KDH_24850 [Dictyobacter sp. S3.2.2.5]|uniref:Alpha-galactosidase n=1 Tax=Dictyobacter halimunensis TaxID=3026934 RepID=A0ABQ6FS76_9CHLR|nr:hypothetical protein KDH_24850 [Dictyobacter sp. S3.2.2.5]